MMSKFEEIRSLALSDSALLFKNRALAANLAFQVLSAIEGFLEPPSLGCISVVGVSNDSTMKPLKKLKFLEEELILKDSMKYNEFQCGVMFDFASQSNTHTSVFYLDVYVAEERCRIFEESFDVSDDKGIGECTFKHLKEYYDSEREQSVIGFIQPNK